MSRKQTESDAELTLAQRLEAYCQRLESLRDGGAAKQLADSTLDELPAQERRRWSRARAIAEQLAALNPGSSAGRSAVVQPDATLVGQRFGRFKIRELIGMGGFGVVYRAYDPTVDREVAIKVPRLETLLNAEARQRFLLESQTVARLDHPHIAGIIESCEIDGLPVIVSPYCAGVSLANWMLNHPRGVPSGLAVQIVLPLAEAVAHAHAKGVLHRDIKPGNILLVPADSGADPQPMLTDFGLAKCLESGAEHTHTGDVLGTVGYTAPEQATGRVHEITTASDVYALGMILYELLTGQTAFAADTKVATLSRILTEEALPPRRLRPLIPRDLEAVCLRCLEKAPAARYQSANELAADLRRAQRGDPTLARPLSWRERAWRGGKKRPALAALSALSLFLLITCTIGGIWYSYRLANSVAATKSALARAQASETRSGQLLYAAEMKLASDALARADLRQVRQLVDRHANDAETRDHRTLIWHFLNNIAAREPAALQNRVGVCYSQAVSSDGAWLAVAGKASTVQILDPVTLAVRRSLPTQQGEINVVSINDENSLIATAGRDGSVVVWSLDEAAPRLRLPACRDGEAYDVKFVPRSLAADGQTLITAGEDRALRLWNAGDGSLVGEIPYSHTTHVDSVQFSPDGLEAVVLDGQGRLSSIDVVNQEVLAARPVEKIGFGMQVRYSPDGRWLAVAGTRDGVVVLDRGFREQAYHPVTSFSKHSLAWSDDSRRIFVGDRAGTIHAFEITPARHEPPLAQHATPDIELKLADSWPAHAERAWSLVLTDDKNLVSSGADGRLARWELGSLPYWTGWPDAQAPGVLCWTHIDSQGRLYGATETTLIAFDRSMRPQVMAPLPRGDRPRLSTSARGGAVLAAVNHDEGANLSHVALFHTDELRAIGEVSIPGNTRGAELIFADDQRHLVVGLLGSANVLHLFEVPSLRPVAQTQLKNMEMHVRKPVVVQGQSCAVVKDENDLVALRMVDLKEIVRVPAHGTNFWSFVASPDGQFLYTLGGDGMKCWRAETLECLHTLAGEHYFADVLGISPDGLTLVSVAYDIRFWDVRTSQQVLTVPLENVRYTWQVEFMPDPYRMMLAFRNGFEPRVFNVRSPATLPGR